MADFLSTFVPVSFAALVQKALTTTTAIAVFFGGQPLVYEAHRQTASTAAAIAPAASSFISAPFDHAATTTTIINQYITRPVIERTVERNASASNDDVLVELRDFDSRLAALAAAFNVHQEASAPLTGGGGLPYANTFGLSQRIDTLANTAISNPIITGGSITGAAIAGTLTNAINSAIATIADLTTVELVATNATITNATTTNLHVAGTVNFVSPLSIASGGIGTSTAPAYGQLLLGNALGGYDLVATSSLGITTTAWGNISGTLASQTDLQSALSAKLSLSSWFSTTTDALTEGASNKYYSDTMVNAYLHASTTLAKTYAANTWSALQQFDNASSTNFSSFGTAYFGGAATSTIDSAGNLAIVSNGLSVGASQLVVSSGNVGIGTTSPTRPLTVRGTGIWPARITGTDSIASVLELESTAANRIWEHGVSGSYIGSGKYYIADQTAGATRLTIDTSGNVGIGTTNPTQAVLVVNGGVAGNYSYGYLASNGGVGYASCSGCYYSIYAGNRIAAPEFNAVSDRRLKTDIAAITSQLADDFIASSTPVSYTWASSTDEGLKFGFIAQDVSRIGFGNMVGVVPNPALATTTDSDNFTSPGGAQLVLSYEQIIPLVTKAVQNIVTISGTFQHNLMAFFTTWLGSASNGLAAILADRLQARRELCVGSTCVTESQLQAMLANANMIEVASGGNAQQHGSLGSVADAEPPVITVNGNNPAYINTGETYADLGATVTDNIDLNLGVHVFIDGMRKDQAVIDTSAPATHLIDYVAIDAAGNRATSTRAVIVERLSPASMPE